MLNLTIPLHRQQEICTEGDLIRGFTQEEDIMEHSYTSMVDLDEEPLW